ncbi:MAG: hypothetical protein GXO86_00505 [Chlorobi bacterium]|nr:hypothetical protein [Chlorobiota bacterium]
MKTKRTWTDFILKEWLLLAAATGFVLTSGYLKQLPSYSVQEYEVLFILFSLFVVVKGLEHSGLISRISYTLEKGRAVPLKLIVATLLLSMLITNDAALIVLVPLTLMLNIKHKDILVILEALAANAGSALTPFGNPQNLFIYWYYNLSPGEFISTIAPFTVLFAILLILSTLLIRTKRIPETSQKTKKVEYSAYIYGALLILVLLVVLRILPVYAAALVFIYVLIFERKSLFIDYSLILSFFFFFGVAENLKVFLGTHFEHPGHIFLFSVASSQVMSNVPAALLFAKLTTQWKALLWGTNVGGFGSLIGSFANLIAYKLYINNNETNHIVSFTTKFLLLGYLAFFIGIGLYFFFGAP